MHVNALTIRTAESGARLNLRLLIVNLGPAFDELMTNLKSGS